MPAFGRRREVDAMLPQAQELIPSGALAFETPVVAMLITVLLVALATGVLVETCLPSRLRSWMFGATRGSRHVAHAGHRG